MCRATAPLWPPVLGSREKQQAGERVWKALGCAACSFFPLCSLLDACHSTERPPHAAARSLPLPGASTAVCCARCRLFPPTRLGNRDLIIEWRLLRWSDLVSAYPSTPILPSRFSPLRRGSRILEAYMFIMDCSVRTWGVERGGKEKSFSLWESG